VKARNFAVIIGSMIVIGVAQPWIALLLIIVLFCCAIPLHSWIVGKLTSSKAKNVS